MSVHIWNWAVCQHLELSCLSTSGTELSVNISKLKPYIFFKNFNCQNCWDSY
jgi:hypothetical protein